MTEADSAYQQGYTRGFQRGMEYMKSQVCKMIIAIILTSAILGALYWWFILNKPVRIQREMMDLTGAIYIAPEKKGAQ